ncbi:MAG TPA: ABC transporter permease [Tissierellia bacterium]|nr:ABC transporter permease [Tissierellia bacterium]
MSLALISSMLILSFNYATPIIVAALGGIYAERSGVTNIGIEGMMVIGAFVAAAFVPLFESQLGGVTPWIAIVLGTIAGGIYSLIHAYISIDLRGDQIISGTALNMLSVGIAVYFTQIIFGMQRTQTFNRGISKVNVPILKDIPILGDLLFMRIYPTFFLSLALVVITWFVLFKTRFGLRLRACGEHPSAVDSVGVSVRKMRYIGVILSGLLAGLAGGIMVLSQSTQFTAFSIHGVGFIALASLIFGRWNPWGVLGAGIFFGFSQIFTVYANDFAFLRSVPNEFFFMMPYVFTILAMLLFSRRSVAPKAVGEPYDVSKR